MSADFLKILVLAVVLTPVVILEELYRLYRHASPGTPLATTDFLRLLTPG